MIPNSPSPLADFFNGHYRVTMDTHGTGQSMLDWIALSRQGGDSLENPQGFFCYLEESEKHLQWSAAFQPSQVIADASKVRNAAGCAAIEQEWHGIRTVWSLEVDAELNLEKRRLVLTNQTEATRRITVTSFVEIALAHPAGDLGHMAFSKLFVQTDRLPGTGILTARRRPRAAGERWPILFHALSGAPTESWETDRLRFIGRGRNVRDPSHQMEGGIGNVLDAIFSLRTTVELTPGGSRELCFLQGTVDATEQIAALLERAGAELFPVSDLPDPYGREVPDFGKLGSFSDDGCEYRIRLPWNGSRLDLPPMPWCNVIAQPEFGCLVSESGPGATWSRNSQANRLTPWSNDPVSDPRSDAFYLRDDLTGNYTSPLPAPCPAPVDHEVRHGFGYSKYASAADEIEREVTVFVPLELPVKVVTVRLRNAGRGRRSLSLFSYQRLVLGSQPPQDDRIRTWQEESVLCAENSAAGDFAGGVAFSTVVCDGQCRQHTSRSRRSFLGDGRGLANPAALLQPTLENASPSAGDACFVQQVSFSMDPGEVREFAFLLGEAMGWQSVAAILDQMQTLSDVAAAQEAVVEFWREKLCGLRVSTPCPEIDRMVNGWMAYQSLACRIWGRTAFYQSSGAYGFRDQLQDAGNLCLLWPDLTRRQILLHAGRQFVEGDVLHWWHSAPVNRGVRTRFSDDLLWLPFVTAHYVQSTGDAAILDEIAPFLKAPLLAEGEDEQYLQPELSGEFGTLLEHCCRAIDRSLPCGTNGLPLMGTGDWNDGMNRVGRLGRGESVWMGFFLYQILEDFIPLARGGREKERAGRYAAHQISLRQALETAGWDGQWYRRAYYDDGTPLGTGKATECRIDALVQAWSVLSGAAPKDRATQAMESARAMLVDASNGLIRLLTPPFVDTPEDPGYIKGYVAGVRENGGQYTHASCWMIAAAAQLGWREEAAAWLQRLGPGWHSRHAGAADRYKVEPYAIAADIYGADPHVGRGGWTWYTGSAGWAYRVAVESVLGLRLEQGRVLCLNPCIPQAWPGYEMEFRPPGFSSLFRISVENGNDCSGSGITASIDGIAVEIVGGEVRMPLPNDAATHHIRVILG